VAGALLRKCGVISAEADSPLQLTLRNFVDLLGGITAITLLTVLFVLQVIGILRCPYYGPASCVEESAYTYTSSRNYLRLGFLNSGLLQDFCNSTDPRDHPYVYDHMPAGPDLLFAVLLRLTGEDYRVVRMLLAAVFVVGIWFYLRFCQILLSRLRLVGSGFILCILLPWTLIQGMERLIYNLYPFLAFAPFVAVASFTRTGRTRSLWIASLVALLSSVYLEYSLLSAVIASWVFVYLTGLIEMRRRHLFLILGSIGLGIGLHLVQNMLYLGPETFFRELTMTLGNRTVGVPTQQQMSAFYRSLGLVHHGSHAPQLGVLLAVAWENFAMPERASFLVIGGLSLLLCLRIRLDPSSRPALQLSRRGRRAVRFFFALGIWIAATVVTPILLFPAFAQEVNLRGSGANQFYLAIGLYALGAFGFRQIASRFPVRFHIHWARKAITAHLCHAYHLPRVLRDRGKVGRRAAVMAVDGLVTLGITLWVFVLGVDLIRRECKIETAQLREIIHRWKLDPYAGLEDLKKFAGELYITNINTPTVGFFTDSPGYGVCGPDTVTASGGIDRSRCKVAFMRRFDVYDAQQPRYFFYFWSGDLFPGFADVLPSDTLIGGDRAGDSLIKLLQDRLDHHFTRVYENHLFKVYDLHQRRSHPADWDHEEALTQEDWEDAPYQRRFP
jgi:hypothetical protein